MYPPDCTPDLKIACQEVQLDFCDQIQIGKQQMALNARLIEYTCHKWCARSRPCVEIASPSLSL